MLLIVFIIVITAALLSQLKRDKTFEALTPTYADGHSSFYKWKGINVHFKDEGSGIPIIFLHGTSSSLHTWDKLTSYLKNHVRIIRMDLPGFGLTGPHPEKDYSLNAYIQFLEPFTKYIGVSQFIIAGNSWGGLLAWYYAFAASTKSCGLNINRCCRIQDEQNTEKVSGLSLYSWSLDFKAYDVEVAHKKWVKRGVQYLRSNRQLHGYTLYGLNVESGEPSGLS